MSDIWCNIDESRPVEVDMMQTWRGNGKANCNGHRRDNIGRLPDKIAL
jgi:hypothetical protein